MGVQQTVYSHTFFSFQPGSKYIKSEYFRQKVAHLSSVLKPANSALDVQTDMSECVFFWWAAYQWRYCHDLWFHSRNHRGWMRSGSSCKACTAPAVTSRSLDLSELDWQQELPSWLWASVHTCIQKVPSCGSVDCFLNRTEMERWSTHLKTLMWRWGRNQEKKEKKQQDGGKVLHSFSLSAAAN